MKHEIYINYIYNNEQWANITKRPCLLQNKIFSLRLLSVSPVLTIVTFCVFCFLFQYVFKIISYQEWILWKVKSKAIPCTCLLKPQRVLGGWGSQISGQTAHEGGKVVSPTHRPPLATKKYSCCSFLLQAESTPSSFYGRKDYVNEKYQW